MNHLKEQPLIITRRKKPVVCKRQLYRRIKQAIETVNTSNTNAPNIVVCDTDDASNVLLSVLPHTENINNNLLDISDTSDFIEHTNLIENSVTREDFNSAHKNYLHSQLRCWAVSQNIPRTSVSLLLHILNPLHKELPLDYRTLLKTPTSFEYSKKINNGDYIHLGLVKGLKEFICQNPFLSFNDNLIKLSFNIDGLPLFKSSNYQVWPILAMVVNVKSSPFAVGIFCGHSKPTPLNVFLENFVSELSLILVEGFTHNNSLYKVEIFSFVCDAPVRAFLKNIKSHNAYYSCERCIEAGKFYNNRVVIKNLNIKRTNKTFRSHSDEDHHNGDSPLTALPIDMVNHFVLDYMHCVCLGVTRKLLNTWLSGPLLVRISGQNLNKISERILKCQNCIPIEFNRKPRALNELARFKASEFRTLLLYILVVALKDLVDPAVYDHFLLLHCSMSILLSQQHINTLGIPLARECLTVFVKHCEALYGKQFYVYNVHALYHICDDAEKYGPLDNISAFPFENYLGEIKKKLFVLPIIHCSKFVVGFRKRNH